MLIILYLFINTSVITIYHKVKMSYLHSFVGPHLLNLARALYLTAHLNLDLAAFQGLSSHASLGLQILKGAALLNNDWERFSETTHSLGSRSHYLLKEILLTMVCPVFFWLPLNPKLRSREQRTGCLLSTDPLRLRELVAKFSTKYVRQ